MSINGKQTINIGPPNEPTGSDPLRTAFLKTQNNFDTLFASASPFTNFNAEDGVAVASNPSTGTVTIKNTGVLSLTPGDDSIVISEPTPGNLSIVALGGSGTGSGTVTSVGIEPLSTSRIVVTNTPIISAGNIGIDLATSGVAAGSYNNPNITVDPYGRVTAIANGTSAGTVTSVGLTPGTGVQISGGPITSAGNITVTNTGVVRINPGQGISVSSGNGNVTISATSGGGTVTSVGVTSSQLVITGSPVVTSGVINVNLPNTANFSGNVNANRINANGGNINGNLIVTGNISPAAVNKVGGIKPGPGVDISLDGELTIDTANLPLSFGNFTATENVLSIVNVDEDMILQTEGNAEIQLVGNIGFYKPDGIPPNIANRYFSATNDGQITMLVPGADPTAGAVKIVGSTSGNVQSPINTGTMLHVTGQNNLVSRIYNDSINNYSVWIGRRYNGTATSPTPVLAGDSITRFGATTYTSAGTFTPLGVGRFNFIALEDQTATAQGSSCELSLTAIGANVPTTVATWTVANGMTGNVTGNLTGNIVSITGNLTAGNIKSNASANITGTANVGNLITSGTLSATGNANVGNLGTSGQVIATGNISGGNLTTGGLVSATGNVTGGNLVTTGSANVTGNVNAGNLVLTTGNIIYTPRYGAFYSNVNQTNPVANTARAMTFNNTQTANGVSVASNSQLTIAKTGVYNIQFSAQISKTGGGTGIVDIWLNKNGTPVDWTNTSLPVTSGSPQVAAWNFVENVTVANTYFEIMWSSPDTAVILDAGAANTGPTRPGIPSVIVSVTPVGA